MRNGAENVLADISRLQGPRAERSAGVEREKEVRGFEEAIQAALHQTDLPRVGRSLSGTRPQVGGSQEVGGIGHLTPEVCEGLAAVLGAGAAAFISLKRAMVLPVWSTPVQTCPKGTPPPPPSIRRASPWYAAARSTCTHPSLRPNLLEQLSPEAEIRNRISAARD